MQDKRESPEAIFGRRMKQERERANLSQSQLAAALLAGEGLKLDPTAITRIERGGRTIRLDEAEAIAGHFGQSLDSMLSASPPIDLEDEIVRVEEELEDHRMLADLYTIKAEELAKHHRILTDLRDEQIAARRAAQ